MITLSVEKRDTKAAASRRAGKVPAVVYGPHHEATAIAVDAVAFGKVLRDAGEASVVSLKGLGSEVPALIHEIDLDPLTSAPRHIDFYAVTKGEKVEVMIPLEFVGASAAVEQGANLIKVLHEVEVEADPMSLPQSIPVDLSKLATLEDQIHASDLSLPTGVTLVTAGEEVVALAQAVVEEKEEAAPIDLSSIEVEKKGKEEDTEKEADA